MFSVCRIEQQKVGQNKLNKNYIYKKINSRFKEHTYMSFVRYINLFFKLKDT